MSCSGSAGPGWSPTLPGFLLLPGDGLLLLDAAGRLTWLDAEALQRLGEASAAWLQQPLGEVWPELAARAEALSACWSQGPCETMVAGPGRGESSLVRLFATDVGLGIGLLGTDRGAAVSSPLLTLLAGLLDCVQDALLVTLGEPLDSPGPLIIYANDTLLRESGYQRHELLGRSPRVLQGPATSRVTTQGFGAQLRHWQPCAMEVLNYDRSGQARWVELKAAPLCTRSGWTTHWVAVQRDVTDRRAAEQALQREVITDSLTGLANRRALRVALDESLDRSGGGNDLALIFCDLDRFKEVNDRLGHAVGDALLCEIGRRLQSNLRDGERLFRLGGDEFVVLATQHPHAQQLDALLQRLRGSLQTPWTHDGEELSLSASMGVARWDDCSSVDELLRRADSTMYAAKRRKDPQQSVAFYDSVVDRGAQQRILRRQQLEHALRHQSLQLHGQPLVDLASGRCLAVELLLRLPDREGVAVDTQALVRQAEEVGLIQDLDAWVLHQALVTLADWRHRGLPHDLAINVSPRSLEFWQGKPACLPKGHDLTGLVVEITETVLLQDLDQALMALHAFRDAGARIALDDFGSGFSSLSWLSRAPLDQVKLDRTLIQGLAEDARCRTTLAGFRRLCGDLGLQVIVEGIETEAQRRDLLAMGFSVGQGYLFSRPQPLPLLPLDPC